MFHSYLTISKAPIASMRRSEKHVTDLIRLFTENMTDPFDVQSHPRQLFNISTGLNALRDVTESLLKSVENGKSMMKRFVESFFLKLP